MKLKKAQSKSRSFAFTYFPTKADLLLKQHLQQVMFIEDYFKNISIDSQIRYFIMGKESCPTTTKIHYQGYISFHNAKTFNQCKKFFGLDKIHVEIAKGNDSQNKKYCSKENKLLETGTPLLQGKRTDISHAISILQGDHYASMSQVLEEVHNYQAVRHAELWLKYKEPKRPIMHINIIWIYGSTGIGKTKKVYDDNSGNATQIFTPTSYKWWEGYDTHGIVLIDDIRRDFCKFHELLKLTDIYPFRVETKGGSRQVQFHTLYITAPYSPLQMWEGRSEEDLGQLTRRITQTINMDEL